MMHGFKCSPEKRFDCGDAAVNRLVDDYLIARFPLTSGCSLSRKSMLKQDHRDDRIIQEGYQLLTENAHAEQSLSDGSFFKVLGSGLNRLSRLNSIFLSSKHWSILDPTFTSTNDKIWVSLPDSGSPVCRTWSPFHVSPYAYSFAEDPIHSMYEDFNILTHALTETKRCITSLEVEPGGRTGGLPPFALRRPGISEVQFSRMLTACRKLEVFDVAISLQRMLNMTLMIAKHLPLFLDFYRGCLI